LLYILPPGLHLLGALKHHFPYQTLTALRGREAANDNFNHFYRSAFPEQLLKEVFSKLELFSKVVIT